MPRLTESEITYSVDAQAALHEGASAQSRLQQTGHGVTSKDVRIPIS